MAKRTSYQKRPRRGRCAPSPYTKYQKTPFHYSADYYSWRSRFVRKARETDSRHP